MAQDGATITTFAKAVGVSRSYAGKFLQGYPDVRERLLANYEPEAPHVPASYEDADFWQRAVINTIAFCEYRGLTIQETAMALGSNRTSVSRWSKKFRHLITERKTWIHSIPKTSFSPPSLYFHSFGYCDTPYL